MTHIEVEFTQNIIDTPELAWLFNTELSVVTLDQHGLTTWVCEDCFKWLYSETAYDDVIEYISLTGRNFDSINDATDIGDIIKLSDSTEVIG